MFLFYQDQNGTIGKRYQHNECGHTLLAFFLDKTEFVILFTSKTTKKIQKLEWRGVVVNFQRTHFAIRSSNKEIRRELPKLYNKYPTVVSFFSFSPKPPSPVPYPKRNLFIAGLRRRVEYSSFQAIK